MSPSTASTFEINFRETLNKSLSKRSEVAADCSGQVSSQRKDAEDGRQGRREVRSEDGSRIAGMHADMLHQRQKLIDDLRQRRQRSERQGCEVKEAAKTGLEGGSESCPDMHDMHGRGPAGFTPTRTRCEPNAASPSPLFSTLSQDFTAPGSDLGTGASPLRLSSLASAATSPRLMEVNMEGGGQLIDRQYGYGAQGAAFFYMRSPRMQHDFCAGQPGSRRDKENGKKNTTGASGGAGVGARGKEGQETTVETSGEKDGAAQAFEQAHGRSSRPNGHADETVSQAEGAEVGVAPRAHAPSPPEPPPGYVSLLHLNPSPATTPRTAPRSPPDEIPRTSVPPTSPVGFAAAALAAPRALEAGGTSSDVPPSFRSEGKVRLKLTAVTRAHSFGRRGGLEQANSLLDADLDLSSASSPRAAPGRQNLHHLTTTTAATAVPPPVPAAAAAAGHFSKLSILSEDMPSASAALARATSPKTSAASSDDEVCEASSFVCFSHHLVAMGFSRRCLLGAAKQLVCRLEQPLCGL